MNNNYYPNKMMNKAGNLPNQQAMPYYDQTGNPNAMYNAGSIPDEQSYIENILR